MAWSDYGSSEEKLNYFGKNRLVGEAWHGRITEVERKSLITSVKIGWSEQYGMVGLRK